LRLCKLAKLTFYYLPSDFASTHSVEIYAKPQQSSILDDFSTPIRTLLTATARTEISDLTYAIIIDDLNYETTTYADDDNHIVNASEAISNIAIPVASLAIFLHTHYCSWQSPHCRYDRRKRKSYQRTYSNKHQTD